MTEQGREEIVRRAERVLERCRAAAARSGRSPEEVTVIAVTKTHPLEVALAAAGARIHDFGENRVQEAEEKWPRKAREGIRLHMVGRLQRNKASKALALFDSIHSCDSLRLAQKLSRMAGDPAVRVFLEVNVGGEETKAGWTPGALRAELEQVAALPQLELCGLMTVAPPVAAPEDARRYFDSLRRLSEECRSACAALGASLSMGMTDDYEVAIEEGATHVRVGRAIYGERDLRP